MKVAKNRLVKLALQGTDAVHIADLFKGPTVIAYSDDPVAAAKVSVEFAKTNEKLVILGGAMGKTNLNPDGVKALASLPSLDELRAKLVGMIADAGNADRSDRRSTGGAGRSCGGGICQEERGGVGRSLGQQGSYRRKN